MKLEYTLTDDEVRLYGTGELDTPATKEIQDTVDKVLNYTDRRIVVDFENIRYIASSGLRQLISIYKKCASDGGHLQLINVNPDVMEILKVTNFDKVFDIK